MAIYAASKERSPEEFRGELSTLVEDFENDAVANRRQIRDMFEADRELFYDAGMDILRTAGESRGAQCLLSVLAANGLLLRALCNPELSREEAVVLGRLALRVDPVIDVALARSLADSALSQGAAAIADPGRIMDIVGEIAEPGRIMPSLMRLMRHPDANLRSKAVKMIGRGSHSVKWVMGRLSESDPRVRANAIESLWGVDSPEARTLLNFAASDAGNRVAGNALLGLYYLGDCAVLPEIIKLAAHESEAFRSSAAWLMGQTADPRFTDALRRMIMDTNPLVRKHALASLAQIRATTSQPPVGEAWNLAGRALAGESIKGMRRMMLAAASNDIRDTLKIQPLNFCLSEGAQYITSYKVTEKPLPDAISVVFVIPRSRDAAGGAFFHAVLRCLRWKRPGDYWSILPYIQTGDGEPPPPHDPEPPVFTPNAETLAAALRETPRKLDCTDLWTGVWRAIKPEAGPSHGRRHVVVLSTGEESRVAGHGIFTQMERGRTTLQVISCGPNRQLEDFCSRTNIRCQTCIEEDVVPFIERAYLQLLPRYEIAWQPTGTESPNLKVRVQTPVGWGETLIALE